MKQDLVNVYDENDRYRRAYYTLFATDTVQNLIPKLRFELRYMKVTGYKHSILSYRNPPVNEVEWKIRNSKDMGSWIFSQILAGCDPIFTLNGGRVRKFAKRLMSIHSNVDMPSLDHDTCVNGLYPFLYDEIIMIINNELKETNTRLQDELLELKNSKGYKKSEKEAFKKARKNKFSAK